MRSSLAILFILFFATVPINPADFTKVHLHLHVEYINGNEACVSCWPKNCTTQYCNCSDQDETYHLYFNQSIISHKPGLGPCNKSLFSQHETAYLIDNVQQEVTVVCKGWGRQDKMWINVTVFPQRGKEENSTSNTTGNDSDMLLKCHSTDHKVSCWNLSLIHVSNEDCNANNSFWIISTFSPSLYPNIESEKDVPMLLRALGDVYNFDESENSCVKVTVSFLPNLDSCTATPESAYPQSTPCPEQVPCVEQATDALNQFIKDEPTYVLVSFPILVIMFALLVLGIAIILLLILAMCLYRRHKEKPSKKD